MVAIPPGVSEIGASAEEQAREMTAPEIAAHERPRHGVEIAKPFALGLYPVTRAEYAAFIGATGRVQEKGCQVLTVAANSWGLDPARDWSDPGVPQTDRDPVICVSWNDAQAYAAWMSSRTGKTYRLPSEAEYEYAARAGTAAARYWGDGRDDACRHANVSGLERAEAMKLAPDPDKFFQCRDDYVYTAPVGRFPPNPFGLYDMLGNVWEWTADCWNPSHDGAPADGSARTGGDCGGHVDKGASWVNSPHYLTAAARHRDLTGNRDTVLGFRLARDLE
jgi:formylglycine-generating enzyme required for sulfatase activity